MMCELGLGLDNGVVYKIWYRCIYADCMNSVWLVLTEKQNEYIYIYLSSNI